VEHINTLSWEASTSDILKRSLSEHMLRCSTLAIGTSASPIAKLFTAKSRADLEVRPDFLYGVGSSRTLMNVDIGEKEEEGEKGGVGGDEGGERGREDEIEELLKTQAFIEGVEISPEDGGITTSATSAFVELQDAGGEMILRSKGREEFEVMEEKGDYGFVLPSPDGSPVKSKPGPNTRMARKKIPNPLQDSSSEEEDEDEGRR